MKLPTVKSVDIDEAIERHLAIQRKTLKDVATQKITGQTGSYVMSSLKCINRQTRKNKERFQVIVKQARIKDQILQDPIAFHEKLMADFNKRSSIREMNQYLLRAYPILQALLLHLEKADLTAKENELTFRGGESLLVQQYFHTVSPGKQYNVENEVQYQDGSSTMELCKACNHLNTQNIASCTHCGAVREVFRSAYSDREHTYRKKPVVNDKKKSYNNLLKQLQGGIPTTLSTEELNHLISQLRIYGLKHPATADEVKEALRSYSLNQYYLYTTCITVRYNNHQPRLLSAEEEQRISSLYDRVQSSMLRVMPTRKNLANNSWLLRKILEHLGFDEYVPYIATLKQSEHYNVLWDSLVAYERS